MSGRPYLKWKQIYSVRNRELDDQHKYMFGLLNELYAALDEGRTDLPVGVLVDKARLYGKLHFETEEKLMAASGYPRMARHRAIHEEYCARVEKMSQFTGPDTPFELFIFLKDWWVNHITQQDADYAPWLARMPGKSEET
jgi:hemerythrin